VTDPFPGVTVVGPNTPSQGSFDPGTGVWSVGTLAPEASATLTVTDRVDVLGPIAGTAHARADQFDPDLSNNTSGALLIGLANYSSEADKYDFARVGGQAREEEASDGRPEVEALDDFFTLAGEDTDLLDLLGGASGMLTLSLLATAAAVVAFDQAARQAQARLDLDGPAAACAAFDVAEKPLALLSRMKKSPWGKRLPPPQSGLASGPAELN